MARQPPRHVEILVHVAAAAAAADDARHRRLACAYLAFDPPAREPLPEPLPEPPPEPLSEPAVFGACDSQDLSFDGALDNRSSPRLRAPASQVGDSYPLPDAGVLTTSPSRVLRRYLGSAHASTGTPTSAASSPGPDAVDVPSSLPRPARRHEPPSQRLGGLVIPVTPVVRPALGKRTGAEPDCSTLADVTHVSSSFASHQPASSVPRAESEPPPPPHKRPRPAARGDAPSPVLGRGTSDAGPVAAAPCDDGDGDGDGDALEIWPPSPPAGTAHVDAASLVSDKLAKLARDLSSRYRPSPARRALEPLERGYWLLDCSAWPPQTRRDTWVFLTNYLRSGLAGWGVWCRRAAAAPPRQSQPQSQPQPHAWIRLYCWACVAKHTYLLLYLASARRVKATGAAWYGADGQPALEVPPAAAARP